MDLYSEDGNLFSEFGIEEDSTLYVFTTKFDDGHFADINVNSGQKNCWIDYVLYDKEGYELSCSCEEDGCICDKDIIELEYEGAKYFIEIKVI